MIGEPVRHSLSPVLHNAGYRAMGLDWAYLAFAVPTGAAPEALAALRALDLGGLNVTMPHKAVVAAAVDRCSPTATVLGSVNTVVLDHGALVGHSTDGDGFLTALREDQGFDPARRRCLILGAGGAARAVVHALAVAGAAEVVVAARRPEAAGVAAALAGAVGRVGSSEEADRVDLVVNATPVGMAEVDPDGLGLDPGRLAPGQLVVDLVYQPTATPLLVAAFSRGATGANGVGMLVHQAALAFRLFTGESAPLDAMRAAVDVELARRAVTAGVTRN